ncbi:MAG: hypothetical protein R2874_04960 [Desulfobacterales bacterium]
MIAPGKADDGMLFSCPGRLVLLPHAHSRPHKHSSKAAPPPALIVRCYENASESWGKADRAKLLSLGAY